MNNKINICNTCIAERCKPFLLIILLLALSSCGSGLNRAQTGVGLGAVGGAIIGQAIGHNRQSTLVGIAMGTMAGYIVGNEMDKYDNQQLAQVYEYGASGKATPWKNPDTGNVYSVTPQPVVKNNSGVCRTAEIRSTIDGRSETTLTTACRDSNGRWVL